MDNSSPYTASVLLFHHIFTSICIVPINHGPAQDLEPTLMTRPIFGEPSCRRVAAYMSCSVSVS